MLVKLWTVKPCETPILSHSCWLNQSMFAFYRKQTYSTAHSRSTQASLMSSSVSSTSCNWDVSSVQPSKSTASEGPTSLDKLSMTSSSACVCPKRHKEWYRMRQCGIPVYHGIPMIHHHVSHSLTFPCHLRWYLNFQTHSWGYLQDMWRRFKLLAASKLLRMRVAHHSIHVYGHARNWAARCCSVFFRDIR